MAETLTLVVPVYNEADFVPMALPGLIDAAERAGAPYRIIIVENGSTDGTAEVVGETAGDAPVEVISREEADYGAAMRAGFLAAEGDWVVNLDIDYFSADFLEKVLGQPDTVDLVIGSKRDPSSRDRRPLIRRVATQVFNLLLRLILSSRVTDTHGMKGFRHALVHDLVPQVISNRDLFDTELVVRAERAGYRIVEVPVHVQEMRLARSSLLKRVPGTILGLFRIRRLLGEG
ncbi:MAG: glycosyltransferase [Acidimicrobiia bacterium]